MSIISNTEIYDNVLLTKDEVLEEIEDRCSVLCFFTDNYSTYLTENDGLMDITPSKYLFVIISSQLEISSGSWIYNEEYLIDSFSSVLEIADTQFTDIQMMTIGLKLTTSNVTISNLTVSGVTSDSSNPHFIFLNLDSILTVAGFNFVNNEVPLMIAITSVLDFDSFITSNVT